MKSPASVLFMLSFLFAGSFFNAQAVAAGFAECKTAACALPKTTARYFVRYGGERSFTYAETQGQKTLRCDKPFMGDPAIGKTKDCRFLQAPASSERWSDCATQGGLCDTKTSTNEVRRARLGYGKTWVYFYTAQKEFQCGLPYMGLGQERVCQISSKKFTAGWKKCADDGGRCKLDGNGLHLVRYIEKSGSKRHLMQLISGKDYLCSINTFRRDPAPNARKVCETASLKPVDSDAIGRALDKEFAADDAKLAAARKKATQKEQRAETALNAVRQTRKFSSCVKSDAYEKPTITFILKGIGWGSRDETATATKSRLPNAIGWRTCGLGPGSSTYLMSYGTTASSRFVYQETSGLKTMPCDYKLQGDIAPGKKKTCWSHKPKSTPNVNWRRCATDGKVCKTGLSTSEIAKGAYLKARYGKGSKWVYRYVSANFSCGSTAMGMGMGYDPEPGVVKECQIAASTKATPKWTQCAKENGTCTLPTDKTTYLVRYGSAGNQQTFHSLVSAKSFTCAIGQITGRATYKTIEGTTGIGFGGGHNSTPTSYAPGDIFDPAPGKAKFCAFALPEDGFRPAY